MKSEMESGGGGEGGRGGPSTRGGRAGASKDGKKDDKIVGQCDGLRDPKRGRTRDGDWGGTRDFSNLGRSTVD
jgi:hypothetical protein